MITSRRLRLLMMSPKCSACTACASRRSSSRRGSNRAPFRMPCSIHLDHQNDPVALLPQSPEPAAAGQRKAGQPGAIPRLAGGAGQSCRGTADPDHATTPPRRDTLVRQAVARAAQTESGPPRPGRGEKANIRSMTCRKKVSWPQRSRQTKKGRAPAERAMTAAPGPGGRLSFRALSSWRFHRFYIVPPYPQDRLRQLPRYRGGRYAQAFVFVCPSGLDRNIIRSAAGR